MELTVENGPQVGAEVLRTLDAAGVPIAGLALREPSLDDVFLSLTGHKSEAEAEPESDARSDGRDQGPGAQDGAQARQTARSPGRREGRRMTTITVPTIAVPAPRGTACAGLFADILTVTWRNLLAFTRIPEALFFSTLQPIMFVLAVPLRLRRRHPHPRRRPLRRLHDARASSCRRSCSAPSAPRSAWPRTCRRG